jgi:hypothetical protein
VKPSDQVREYCKKSYIEPARQKGLHSVTIRAGDVHSDMKFKNRLPLVCSALGTKTFEAMCGVRRTSVNGPLNGANTTFTFELL